MRGKISIDLSFCQAENGYSLDELVQKLANCFEQKAYSELLRMILQMTQKILLYRILYGKSDAMKCCSQGHLTLNGSFERRIRTSLGEFKMDFWRVRCSHCGKIFATLAKFIGKIGMFGYVRRWQKWGLISPRDSSMVERVMRELGRRIKKIAYGWSDKEVTKVARIILKRFANAKEWEEYWQKRMKGIGNVVITLGNYQRFSQNLGH